MPVETAFFIFAKSAFKFLTYIDADCAIGKIEKMYIWSSVMQKGGNKASKAIAKHKIASSNGLKILYN